jgi:hypothetical protein
MNMSYNNKWYLFYNRLEETLYVFELQTLPPLEGQTKQQF